MAKTRRIDPRAKKKSDHSFIERQPPANLEAERAVLGSILLKPDVLDDVVMILVAEDFYDDAHSILFQQMRLMHDAGRKIDITLLIDALKREDQFEKIGGESFLAEIANSVATAAHAVYYAKIVLRDSTSRSLIDASTDILRDAYDSGIEPQKLLGQAEQRIFSIMDGRSGNSVKEIKDALHEAMDRLDARMKGDQSSSGVDTGFNGFDNLTGGLHDSELIILAARPSMGKTALAMNIAEYVSIKLQKPTLFISLEMSSVELADRLLCSAAEVDGRRLRNGTITQEERHRLVKKSAEISGSPLFVDDSPSRTVSQIAAAARRIKRRDGDLGLIVIDYLQLVEPDNSSDPRQEQVAKMARRLKGMARELEVPVLCLAQLNRQAEVAKENRPRLSHLRESGAIEQDADVVMFVHREEYYRTPDEREQFAGQAEIIIAKQRNGPIGDIELIWRKEFTRFANPASDFHDEFESFNAGEAF